jgi:hypothetical protein
LPPSTLCPTLAEHFPRSCPLASWLLWPLLPKMHTSACATHGPLCIGCPGGQTPFSWASTHSCPSSGKHPCCRETGLSVPWARADWCLMTSKSKLGTQILGIWNVDAKTELRSNPLASPHVTPGSVEGILHFWVFLEETHHPHLSLPIGEARGLCRKRSPDVHLPYSLGLWNLKVLDSCFCLAQGSQGRGL